VDFSYMGMGNIGVEYITAGKYISERAPMIHQRRQLSSFVLFYGIKGTLYISDGGKEYAMAENEYLLLAADREHVGIKPSSPGLSYYWCHFSIEGEYRLSTDESGAEFIEFGTFKMPMYGAFPEPSKMHLLFHQLIDSTRTVGAYSKLIANNFLGIILAKIASSDTSLCNKNMSMLAENITQWIKLNATQIRNARDVATYFGYNCEYLTTMVKKATGKTLTEHITQQRMEKAKELLRTTGKTVQEIAYESGFGDEKYFMRVFKKHLDVTPTVFRNTYTKQKMNDK
jgi:AraC-like DNA-binding protein